MSLSSLDVDVMAFLMGGQFFEDDVEDETLACFTDGQFGIELEAAVIPSPAVSVPFRAGGGGASYIRYAVPVSECWDWDKDDEGKCEGMYDYWSSAGGGRTHRKPRRGQTSPFVPPQYQSGLGVVVDDDKPAAPTGRLDVKSMFLGAAIGVAVYVAGKWIVQRWARGEWERLESR
jgi:hypothetical protein